MRFQLESENQTKELQAIATLSLLITCLPGLLITCLQLTIRASSTCWGVGSLVR